MKLKRATITNFRRLCKVELEFENKNTIFVGPNNSGKTSATSIFRNFLDNRKFKIHDFSLTRLSEIDSYNLDKPEASLPEIGLDLWFSLDSKNTEYGHVASLISDLNDDIVEVGIGCTFSVNDSEKLWHDYKNFYKNNNNKKKKTLSAFLGIEGHLKKYFSIRYAALKKNATEEATRIPLPPDDGKRILHSLLRVDFVDAQRNMQDDEEKKQGGKLSTAFGKFYQAHLQQVEANEEAIKVFEENNDTLTKYYDKSFKGLMTIFKQLGVPSANERELKIISILNSEEALKGTTDLFYKDANSGHLLPEAYNGLGFKNLVLMAIQMRNFQIQWKNTKEDRPLCHIIFVEEPEAHLHAQVQQTFISNMWTILDDLTDEKKDAGPQLVVTTHSSHILNSADFNEVRYFRRCHPVGESQKPNSIFSASEVHNLRNFKMDEAGITNTEMSPEKALEFLKRYLTLMHCDLMFADAAILIEGATERLLLPSMIEKAELGLERTYLTILEVGGAYAHIFVDLMKFLYIPYLIITDIDSVKKFEGGKQKEACCAKDSGAETSNGVLKAFFKKEGAITITIAELRELTYQQQAQENNNRFVAFQKPVTVKYKDQDIKLHGRTFEETFIYENLEVFQDQDNKFPIKINPSQDVNEINQHVFNLIKSSSKKVEFALQAIADNKWKTPNYIVEGLSWLAKRLGTKEPDTKEPDTKAKKKVTKKKVTKKLATKKEKSVKKNET